MLKDSTILQRVAIGDRSAVDDCIEKYGGLIWSIGKRYLRDVADLEDVTQEVFIELWQTAKRFDPARGTEPNFVALVARRRMVDRLRRMGTEQNRVPTESIDDVVDIGTVVSDHLMWGEEIERTAHCLEKLESVRKQVLVLHLRDGFSLGRISEALKLPLGTIKSHARRGLLQVQRCVGFHDAVSQVSSIANGEMR